MHKFLIVLVLTCLLMPMDAIARDALKDRRTLFAQLGDKDIVLEAPRNMCFFDQTNKAQNIIFQETALEISKKKRGQLIALFAPCLQIVAMSSASDSLPLQDLGAVIWALPQQESALALPASDYLDLRMTSFHDETKKDLFKLNNVILDDKPTLYNNALFLGYSGSISLMQENHTIVGVDAATVLQGEPIDISINRVSPATERQPDLRPLMKKFLDQQHVLNDPL